MYDVANSVEVISLVWLLILAHLKRYLVALYLLWEVWSFDIMTNGLWCKSNGRVLSFCDSVYAMYRYRSMRIPLRKRTPSEAEYDVPSVGSTSNPPTIATAENSSLTQPRFVKIARWGLGMRKRVPSFSAFAMLHPRNSNAGTRASIFAGAVMCKYFAGTMVALMLNETPTWMQGFRHPALFILTFGLMQVAFFDLILNRSKMLV